MRIRREPASRFQFAAEILQLLGCDAAFKIRAGINPRGGVSLKIDEIAISALSFRPQEMVERDFVQGGS